MKRNILLFYYQDKQHPQKLIHIINLKLDCSQNNEHKKPTIMIHIVLLLQIAHQTSARHRIIIKSDTVCDETNETYDSIIIVSGNKQKILETIITCLEEPFHEILQKWLKDLTIQESLSESAYDIIVEIEAIRKHLVFDVHENADAVSVLKRSGSKSIVPDNVKKYLFE